MFALAALCIFMAVWLVTRQSHSSEKNIVSKKDTTTYANNSLVLEVSINQPLNYRLSEKLSIDNYYNLPKTLEDGKTIYSIRKFPVVGSQYDHFGNNRQEGISHITIGDYVTLKHDVDNKYSDTAVAVFNSLNEYCGWLPEETTTTYCGKNIICEALMKGISTKSIVINKYINNHNKIGSIELAVGTYKHQNVFEPSSFELELSSFELECFNIIKEIVKNNIPSKIVLYPNRNSAYFYIYYEFEIYTIELLRIRALKKYTYVLITDKDDIEKIRNKGILYEEAPSSEQGIRVIINSPIDINRLSDIIINKFKNTIII